MKNNDSHNHKNCKKLFARLSEFIDRELDADVCNEIEKHLNDCECCTACLETLRQTIDLCKSLEEKSIPKNLSHRLRQIGCH